MVTPTGALNRGGVGCSREVAVGNLRPIFCCISEMVHDRVIVTMEVNANRNSCVLCRMALFPVTLSDLQLPQTTSFLSQAGTVRKRLNRFSSFLAHRLPSAYPTLCWKGIRVSPKIRVIPSRPFTHTLDLNGEINEQHQQRGMWMVYHLHSRRAGVSSWMVEKWK